MDGGSNSKCLMDFTGGAPVLSNTGIGNTGSFEGTAVSTTPTATLPLYTDGDSIFNGQTHALIGRAFPHTPGSCRSGSSSGR